MLTWGLMLFSAFCVKKTVADSEYSYALWLLITIPLLFVIAEWLEKHKQENKNGNE